MKKEEGAKINFAAAKPTTKDILDPSITLAELGVTAATKVFSDLKVDISKEITADPQFKTYFASVHKLDGDRLDAIISGAVYSRQEKFDKTSIWLIPLGVFLLMKKEKPGLISKKQFVTFVLNMQNMKQKALGEDPVSTKDELVELFDSQDDDHDGYIDIVQFHEICPT